MAYVADLKMAVLAVTIVLASLICIQDEDRLGQVEPVLMDAPATGTTILAG